jgi:hypothetical protein
MELVYKRRYGAQQRYKKMVLIIYCSVGTQNAVCLILLVVIVQTIVLWARERSYKLCCAVTFLKAAYFLDRILSKNDREFIVAYCTAGRQGLPPSVHGRSVPSVLL